MKGDKMAKRSSFGSMVRRRLSDITNSLPQPKSPAFPEKHFLSDNASANQHIDYLVKVYVFYYFLIVFLLFNYYNSSTFSYCLLTLSQEKMALMKLIQEKK